MSQRARIAIEGKDMGIQAVTSYGGDIGDSCHLKIVSASVEASEFNPIEVMLSE